VRRLPNAQEWEGAAKAMTTRDREDRTCKVVGISGSLRPGSYTKMAVAIALKGAEELKCETRLIDLRDYELVFCDGKDDESHFPKDVFRLRDEVKQAKGIILGTPEYHGGYSGVLKNALDLMGFDEFEGKMLGLVGVSGGAIGAFSALESLRNIGRALHAWVVPEVAAIAQAWNEFDAAGNLKDPKLDIRVRQVGRQVARFSYLHGSCQANEFLQRWEKSLENPGGEDR
jgi:NAD(P)H-dependent FMN reductase